MILKEKDREGFEKAVEVVMKYLANPKLFRPHIKVIIDSGSAELVEGIISHSTDKFIVD